MRNILLTIKYDGTCYHGWQRQKEFPSVQGEIEKALRELMGTEVEISGTSRTDKGVHALAQRASFLCPTAIPTERIAFALTNLLPGDIEIVEAVEVAADFHARFDAKGKTYTYKIVCPRISAGKAGGAKSEGSDAGTGEGSDADADAQGAWRGDMFLRNHCYFVDADLDVDAMRTAAAHIVGTHDFAAFEGAGGDVRETTVRTIYSIDIDERTARNGILEDGDEARLVEINVKGDGFLYNMVRIIAGTLVEVGLGKIEPEKVKDIVASCDRTKAGHTAPPQGLYLRKIYFDEEELENA